MSWNLALAAGFALLPLAVVVPLAGAVYASLGDRVESVVVGVALFETACMLVAGGYLLLAPDPVAVGLSVPTQGGLLLALLAVPFPFALEAASEPALDRLDVEMESALALDADQLPWMVAVSLLLVGPAEELLYRGVVQGLLVGPLGTGGGVLAMAALFGAVHYPSYGAQSLADVDAGVVAGGLLTATVGVVYGALYVATGTLLVPVVTHSLYDAALFVRTATRSDAEGAQTSTENSS